jgi:hypothetical protein
VKFSREPQEKEGKGDREIERQKKYMKGKPFLSAYSKCNLHSSVENS